MTMSRFHRHLSAGLLLRAVLAAPLAVTIGAAALPATAIAQQADLDALKASGTVGERFDGYVAVVKGQGDAATQRVIDQINLQRKDRYREIAGKRGTSLSAVEQIAGAQIIERAPSGSLVMPQNGTWVRKP
ncbi:YdbL family protein [Tistrella bauzanensis]|uniref:YdbL family protein n=1 Tax=Tistrella arctica TaxID=3133430 RepID=A0ABU9YT69_9PROT